MTAGPWSLNFHLTLQEPGPEFCQQSHLLGAGWGVGTYAAMGLSGEGLVSPRPLWNERQRGEQSASPQPCPSNSPGANTDPVFQEKQISDHYTGVNVDKT